MVSSDLSPVFGQSITLTATITATAPGAGIPTEPGTVTFLDGTTPLGTVTLNGSGMATYSTAALGLGTHSFTVSYSGDADFTPSTSPATSVVVYRDGSTAAVSPLSSIVYGQSTTLSVTVAAAVPGAGTPTGTVTFYDGATPLGTGPTALNGGVATLSVADLLGGTHSITAAYAGDTDFAPVTSAPVSLVVTQQATTATLSSSAGTTEFGQSVTFTATVAGVGTEPVSPTGTVTFYEGATNLGTGTLDGSGVATLAVTSLATGSDSITAVYSDDANYQTSTASAITQTVTQAATSVAAPTTSGATAYGQSVTFTATVVATAPGAGTPSGTVTFYDGGTSLGTGTLTGGVATFATTALGLGTHSITASYGGDTNFQSSSISSATTQTVGKAATTGTVVSSVASPVFGQSITLTATITGAGTPTGTVTFLDGSTTLGTGTLNGSGAATLAISSLSVATHAITAFYGGDSSFTTSTSPATSVVVARSSTTTTLAPPTAIVYGQSITFTATVAATAPGAGTPTGVVTFFDQSGVLGIGSLNGGVATYTTTTPLGHGSYSISAAYDGDTDFKTSDATAVTQIVNLASTTTALTSPGATVFGESVTFTASVVATAPGAGTPTGTITFYDGLTDLGTGTLNGSGVATYSTTALSVGSHSITASYGGDTNFLTSVSSATTQTVSQATTTITTLPTAGGITYGQTLADSTLSDGIGSVPGSFAWTAPATLPGAGSTAESVTFTPTDSTDYSSVTATVSVTVSPAATTITTLPTAGGITYGQTLASSTLSDGIGSVPGSFAWTAPATLPGAGSTPESVTFTPDDSIDYSSVTDTVSVTAGQAATTITSPPTAGGITYGQTLADSTLSGGTGSVAGSFAWTTSTTVPGAGSTPESVTFTPDDSIDYSSVTDTVSVTAGQAATTITSPPTAGGITYGQTLADSTLSGGSGSVAGSFAWTTLTTVPAPVAPRSP